MATKIVLLQPAVDISPLWTPTPNDGSGHYTKIDERVDFADGDQTKLTAVGDVSPFSFRLSALPDDFRRLVQVRPRQVVKSNNNNATFSTLFYVNEVAQTPLLGFNWASLPLNFWTLVEQVATMSLQSRNDVIRVELFPFTNGGAYLVELTAFELEITYKTNQTDFTEVPTPSTTFTKLPV